MALRRIVVGFRRCSQRRTFSIPSTCDIWYRKVCDITYNRSGGKIGDVCHMHGLKQANKYHVRLLSISIYSGKVQPGSTGSTSNRYSSDTSGAPDVSESLGQSQLYAAATTPQEPQLKGLLVDRDYKDALDKGALGHDATLSVGVGQGVLEGARHVEANSGQRMVPAWLCVAWCVLSFAVGGWFGYGEGERDTKTKAGRLVRHLLRQNQTGEEHAGDSLTGARARKEARSQQGAPYQPASADSR